MKRFDLMMASTPRGTLGVEILHSDLKKAPKTRIS